MKPSLPNPPLRTQLAIERAQKLEWSCDVNAFTFVYKKQELYASFGFTVHTSNIKKINEIQMDGKLSISSQCNFGSSESIFCVKMGLALQQSILISILVLFTRFGAHDENRTHICYQLVETFAKSTAEKKLFTDALYSKCELPQVFLELIGCFVMIRRWRKI